MNDVLVWVQDALSSEHFVRKCTEELLGNPSLGKDAESALLVRLVNERAQRHVDAIEVLLGQLDEQPSSVRETVAAGIGATIGWMERLPNRDLIQVVRGVYVGLNYTAAGYHVLYTRAQLLDHPSAASLALRHLGDYTPAIRQLGQLLAWAAALELSPDQWGGKGDMNRIVSRLFACWTSDVPLHPS